MFNQAKIKLTFYYTLILVCITTGFSVVIFTSVSYITNTALENQFRRFESQYNRQNIGFYPQLRPPELFRPNHIETLIEIRDRVAKNLVVINLGLWTGSSLLAYYLAGLTLKPIETMHEQQKRFTSDAAHEMRTPLTSMKTELEVCLRDKNFNANQAKQIILSSIDEVNRLSELTEHLLTLGKIQSNNHYNKESLDLSEIINQITNKYPAAPLKTRLTQSLIHGNKADIQRLVTNLVDNAIKYNKDANNINITTENTHNKVILTVQDQGIGISDQDLPHIFEPFYKADSSRTKTSKSGVGLGLAIVYEIVKKHSGSIKVESIVNQGTTFTIEIPISAISQKEVQG